VCTVTLRAHSVEAMIAGVALGPSTRLIIIWPRNDCRNLERGRVTCERETLPRV